MRGRTYGKRGNSFCKGPSAFFVDWGLMWDEFAWLAWDEGNQLSYDDMS